MNISLSIQVPGAPDEVFPWLDDPEKAMLWQKGVKKAKMLTETSERIGTTFVEEMEEGGKVLEMHGMITAFARNEMIAFHLESRMHEVDACYSVRGGGESSVVMVASTIHWKFPMNLLSLLFGPKIEEGILQQTQAELGELRRLCEEQQRGQAGIAESRTSLVR